MHNKEITSGKTSKEIEEWKKEKLEMEGHYPSSEIQKYNQMIVISFEYKFNAWIIIEY